MNVVHQAEDAIVVADELLALLVSVRGSHAPDDTKLKIRNAVLSYAQASTDQKPEFATALQVLVAPYVAELSVPKAWQRDTEVNADSSTAQPEEYVQSVSMKQTNSLGYQRSAPAFGASTSQAKEPTDDARSPAENTNDVQESSTSSANSPKEAPVSVHGEDTKETRESDDKESQTSLDRIKEIKQSVNKRVGNPVNLIDADNEVGRAYMNALLNAMKQVGSGEGSAGLSLAIDELEKVYKQVVKTLDDKDIHSTSDLTSSEPQKEQSAVNKQPSSVLADERAEATAKVTPEESEAKQALANTLHIKDVTIPTLSKNVTTTKRNENEIPTSPPITNKSATVEVKEDSSVPINSEKLKDTNPSTKPPIQKSVELKVQPKEPTPAMTTPSNAVANSERETQPVSESKVEEPKKSNTLTPVTENESLPKQMSSLKKAINEKEKNKAKEITEDLEAEVVTEGLKQLLSEWSLFKKSGLLGTGPRGINHPLYKQLAPLPMAAVIAGRFEGSTPEIKQSITDYMNGWRYEQEVIHELNEPFEHYLRRVILKILKRQKASTTA